MANGSKPVSEAQLTKVLRESAMAAHPREGAFGPVFLDLLKSIVPVLARMLLEKFDVTPKATTP